MTGNTSFSRGDFKTILPEAIELRTGTLALLVTMQVSNLNCIFVIANTDLIVLQDITAHGVTIQRESEQNWSLRRKMTTLDGVTILRKLT